MYDVDGRDRVIEIEEVPQSSVGAPLPVVIADESTVQLAYYAEAPELHWDGTHVREVDLSSTEPAVIVRFERAYAWFHGPPNDEAFSGHPLASRGLHPYAGFRIEDSSWLRRIESMNAVHPLHDPERFDRLTHYVFAFHDSTFECVAQSFTTTEVEGPLARVVQDLAKELGGP